MREEDSEGPRRLTVRLAARGASGALEMAIEAREVWQLWQRKGSGTISAIGSGLPYLEGKVGTLMSNN